MKFLKMPQKSRSTMVIIGIGLIRRNVTEKVGKRSVVARATEEILCPPHGFYQANSRISFSLDVPELRRYLAGA